MIIQEIPNPNPRKIWFSADHHFDHHNIIRYANRPFANVRKMDSEMIERHNEVVGPNDLVFFLGDLTLSGKNEAASVLSSLNGNIHIIPGDHDKRWLEGQQVCGVFKMMYEYIGEDEGPVPFTETVKSKTGHAVNIYPGLAILELPRLGQKRANHTYPLVITLCHWQMLKWSRSHYPPNMHLFGHSHGKSPGQGLSIDVGVDAWDFYPVSLAKIFETFRLSV